MTHNEALRILDVITQLAVIADDLAMPPANPPEGVRYIVGDGGTGVWTGHDGEVALYETGVWRFIAPRAGWRAYVIDREALIVNDGIDWIDLDSAELQEIEAFGLGMIAPAATPFSAKLNAALWTALYLADGGDGSLVTRLNKETAAGDAGFVFQNDFSARALIGLFGSDDLRIATSSDGSSFLDGLIVDAATGVVNQPRLPRFKAATNFDNFCAADTWVRIAVNAAVFNDQGCFDAAGNQFTAPVDGTYHFGGALTFKQDLLSPVQTGARLVLNGGAAIPGATAHVTGVHVSEKTTLQVATMVALQAGDSVELQGAVAGADGYFMADESSFWGYKVG